MPRDQLSQKEAHILSYIREHPGNSKEQIVRAMNGDPSRITILKILQGLEEKNIIIAKKEKPNSQVYHLFINSHNVLALLQGELEEFKKSFYALINRTYEIQKIMADKQFSPHPDALFLPLGIFRLFDIFLDGTIVYNYRLLFLWSYHIADAEILDKASQLVFSTMNEVRSEIFKRCQMLFPEQLVIVDEINDPKMEKRGVFYFMDKFFSQHLILERLISLKGDSPILGAEKEFDVILNFLKKITDPAKAFDHYIDHSDDG